MEDRYHLVETVCKRQAVVQKNICIKIVPQEQQLVSSGHHLTQPLVTFVIKIF